MANNTKHQHPPLRVPNGWTEQSRALVIQIENLFDDLYRKIGDLREEVKKLKEEVED